MGSPKNRFKPYKSKDYAAYRAKGGDVIELIEMGDAGDKFR